jgi:hypothetical protein
MAGNSSTSWNVKSTAPAYVYVSKTDSCTISDGWTNDRATWRVPNYDFGPVYLGTIYDYTASDFTISTGDSVIDFAPATDVVIDGDLKSEVFEKRFREEIMAEVQQYINGLIPMIISMATERWIPLIERAKQFNNGVFCFNCGAAIIRGKEQEPCEYCGR